MSKCVYCKTQIPDESVVDVCRRCGIGVWGEKMFNAIIQNMEGAKDAGDLYQGTVTTEPNKGKKDIKAKKMSFVADAMDQYEKTSEENADIKYDSYGKTQKSGSSNAAAGKSSILASALDQYERTSSENAELKYDSYNKKAA
jgi:hypothetical protein